MESRTDLTEASDLFEQNNARGHFTLASLPSPERGPVEREYRMRFCRFAALTMVFLLEGAWAAGQHNAVLPRPKKIQYGSRSVGVKGLAIRFASPPSAEDRFTASELARSIRERVGVALPLGEAVGDRLSIVLHPAGAVEPLPVPDEKPGPDSRESYSVTVSPVGVEIRGRSSAALFYGVQTLVQLVEGEGEDAVLPEVQVDDWPSLAYRGTMVDVASEGAMTTEAEIRRQLDFMARWKVNQYYLYNEANIELEGYPLLNPMARFTQEQIRRIVAYGRERHIDVIPCIELYGHLHDLFRIEKYSELADFPHGGEMDPANPKAVVVLQNWAGQFARLFPSAFVHIGFDETWQIEEAARQQGLGATPAKLFLGQLNSVARLFQQHGKRVMAWADVMVKYPEIVTQLPPGLIAVAWHYVASPDPEYKQWLAPLVEKGIPHFVGTGVHSWTEVAPDFETTFENIDTFLSAGAKSKALGLMNTVWTDSGQNLLRASWPGIAYGALASWGLNGMERKQFFSDYASQMYPAAIAPEIATALEQLTRSESSFQKIVGQNSMQALWEDPFRPDHLEPAREHRSDLHQARLLAENAQEQLSHALKFGGDHTTLDSLLLAASMLDLAGMKYLYAVEIADAWEHQRQQKELPDGLRRVFVGMFDRNHSRIADLMDAVTGLRETYRSNWLEEYNSYRFGTALGRWDAEYEYWRRLQVNFLAFASTYHRGDPLPPLDKMVGTR